MLKRMQEFQSGYNPMTQEENSEQNMKMDIGLIKLGAKMTEIRCDAEKESAFLLLTGEVEFVWEGERQIAKRASVFDEEPYCLHLPAGAKVTITAQTESEIILQKAVNKKSFAAKLYKPEDCRTVNFGEGVWRDTALRAVRTVFDYDNAPYSELVIGEVLTYPGKWSSYPPHHHPQPEVYFYKFDKPQGFGCSVIGDEVHKISHNSFAMIPGGKVHPQTSAPGYAMYYCWMIRHLPDNPWKDRINEACHEWLLEKDVKIWPDR